MTTLSVPMLAPLLSALVAQSSPEGVEGHEGPQGIDPLTLLEWKAACELVKEHEAAIWPGYRLEQIPALLMHPKVAEVLIRHPRPPMGAGGYVRFPGASVLGEEPLFVRRGTTTFDGVTDTSTAIGGVTTLVVTDRGARSAPNDQDDAWNLAVAVHEGFHAWAASNFKASSSSGSELDLVDWPDLDAKVNAHLHLEGEALVAAARALIKGGASDELEEQALLFFAERTRRRAAMPATAIRYEDSNELNEGLASYVELRAYELWAEHGLGDEMREALPELQVPKAFRDRADGMLDMLLHSSRGSFSINGSSFGPGVIRRRGYFSGAALGKLLDHFAAGSPDDPSWASWKVEAAKGRSLTELLAEALGSPSEGELAERADALESEQDFPALVAAKEKLAGDARRERAKRIAAVLEGTVGTRGGTLLVIDVSELAPRGPLLPSAWNPFGILKLDEPRRLYSQSTTSFVIGGVRIEALDLAGVIVDSAKRELLLRTPVDPEALKSALKRALSTASSRYVDAGVVIDTGDATEAKVTFELRDEPGPPGTVRLLLRRTPN